MLKPNTHGKLAIRMMIVLMRTDFFLLMPNISIQNEMMFSNTAMIVEKHAKVINRKNRVPQILPPAIFTNTFGSVTKIRAGPWSG